jgi:hypothetical protein
MTISTKKVFESCKTPAEKKQRLQHITEAVKSGEINPIRDFKLSEVLEGTCGKEVFERLKRNDGANLYTASVWEDVDPVNQNAFTNISQLLVLQGVVSAYESPEYIGDQLCTTITSPDDNVRIPGVNTIPLQAVTVAEGEEYPDAGVPEDYIDTPRSVKTGLKIGLTKEAIFFDRTGVLLERCAQVGERCGTGRELRILRTVLGLDNTFKRTGTARNTYVATGGGDPRINKLAANSLTDWKSVEAIWLLFAQMMDDRNVAEPIQVKPDTVIVPLQKYLTAQRIFGADAVRTPSETADGSNTLQTYSKNPLSSTPWGVPKVLTSQWIYYLLTLAATNSNPGGQAGQANSTFLGAGLTSEQATNYWYMGNFKKAFGYRQVWPLQVITAPANNMDEFEKDIMVQYRASERGVPFIKEPWQVAQSYND